MKFIDLFESDFTKPVLKENDGEECHVCNGTGEGRTEHENCSHCGGSGMEPSDRDNDDYEMYDTDDDYDRGGDDESHYEKYVRTRGLEEADQVKKKDDEPQVRDVGLQRAITRAKSDFPAAGSGIEALAKDFMRSQDQDQKSFDQLRAAERQQSQLLKQISQLDQQQSQEIDNLEQENSQLAQRLERLQSVNSQLEKKLASMAGRKTEPKADKATGTAERSPDIDLPEPQAAEPRAAPAKSEPKEPSQSRAIGQMTKSLTAPSASPAFDRISQELQPRQKELGFDEPVTLKPKKYDTSRAADVDYRDVTSKIAKNIMADPAAAGMIKRTDPLKQTAGQRDIEVEAKQPTAHIRPVKRERADGSVETTYELVNARGVTVKTGMSQDTAKSHLKYYKQRYGQ